MATFTLHTPDTATAAAGAQLAGIEKAWKFIPNLHRILAESPELLVGYDTLFGLVGKTSFTPAEQQIAFLAVNYENECEYCMAGHSVLAAGAKVPADVIGALRENQPVADSRIQALRSFVQNVVQSRGKVGDRAVDAGAGRDRRAFGPQLSPCGQGESTNFLRKFRPRPVWGKTNGGGYRRRCCRCSRCSFCHFSRLLLLLGLPLELLPLEPVVAVTAFYFFAATAFYFSE